MGHSRLIRIALILAIIALLLFIVERVWTFGQFIGGVLSTLVAAWFVAFLIKPLVVQLQTGIIPPLVIEWLEQRYPAFPADKLRLIRLPMSVAVIVAYLIFLIALIGGVTIATATIIPQAADLISRIPGFAATLPEQLAEFWAGFAARFGLDPAALEQFIASQDIPGAVTQTAGIAAAQVLSVAAFTASFIGQFFLVLILSLYIVVEDRLLIRQLFMVLPRRTHETARAMLTAVDRAFSGYLRGQFIGAVLRGLFTLIVFGLFQVKFGVVVAIVFALSSFVPLIGGPIGIAFAAIVVLIVNSDAVLPVTLLMFAFDQFVAYGIMPRLMKDLVGVPGLVALLAISVGVQLLGFWGVIFGVPFIGAVYALVFDFYLPRRRKAEGLPEEIEMPESLVEPLAAQPSRGVRSPGTPPAREEPAAPTLKRSP
ncbi:MAG: AI-2E family transporter [Candidatus Brachytrichaceae bacterium NZ_4S206]|jgi:predicted PurR-regulated permease PerM